MKAKFTDAFLKAVKPPQEGRLVVTDETTPCLTLRVTHTGTKSWSIQYRPKGQPQRRVSYGTYPSTSLADARARAKAITAAASVGRDLIAEEIAAAEAEEAAKAAEVARSRTLRQVAAEYIEKHCKHNQRKWQLTENMFDHHVLPRLGDKAVLDLRRADIIELLDELQHKKGFGAQTNRVHAAVKACLNWAVEREYLDANPAAAVKKRVVEEARERVLTDDELKAIWNAAGSLTEPSQSMVKVMILTGQRRDEVRCLPWAELDLDADKPVWVLPKSRNKAKREHVIPLSDEVTAILKLLPRKGEPAVYVFTIDGARPYAGQKRLKENLDTKSKVAGWTFHDLRRTAASGMAALRISHDIIGRVLNHSKSDVTAKHYNRHDYLDEKRAGLQAWARHVMALVNANENQNVVSLRSG